MSMSTAYPHRPSRRAWFVLGLVIAGVALSAIVAVATTAADNDAGVARTGRPAAAQLAAVAPTTDSSVPNAAAAFSTREMQDEEPAPTF